MVEPADAPFLVGHEQEGDLRERLRAGREGIEHAEGQHHAALHVDRARADQAVILALEGAVGVVRHDRVDVAEKGHPLGSGAADPRQEVRRVPLGRGRKSLGLGVGGEERRAERHGLLGSM